MELQATSPTVKTAVENFVGDVYANPVFAGDESCRLRTTLVRFTAGARTNWHAHAHGQLLVCTDGIGLVGSRDGTTIVLRPGDAIWTPPGEHHWHGGTASNMMCHYAIFVGNADGDATSWFEAVDDDHYAAANSSSPGSIISHA